MKSLDFVTILLDEYFFRRKIFMKKSYAKPEVAHLNMSTLENVSASFDSFQGLSGIGTDVGITSYEFMSAQG